MSDERPDLTTALFVLPPDARLMELSELSERVRATLGPTDEGQRVVTRPGFRVTARLVSAVFADLVQEFRVPSLLTAAVKRYAEAGGHDALELLDLAFDPLASLIEARILVPEGSPDASAPEPTLGAGQMFAGYEVDALIRSLEDSEVYRARAADGSPVALKIARAGRTDVASSLAHEARVLEHLDGIDVPRLVTEGSSGDRRYIAMAWCDGESLTAAAQRARATGDWRHVHNIVRRLLDAYARLHDRGVLHGDVHPGNCLVRDDGRMVLLDFGQARTLFDGQTDDVSRGGVPQFYDPQMAEAALRGVFPPGVTPESEQYSIAVLAYLVLTGLPPTTPASGLLELLERIAHWQVRPFATCGIPSWPDVERVLGRGLSKQPGERFPDMAGMAAAFAVTSRTPIAAPTLNGNAARMFGWAAEATRRLERVGDDPEQQAWFALRASVALGDPELLAAADVIVRSASPSWTAEHLAVMVARARSDASAEKRALGHLVSSAESLTDLRAISAAILSIAQLRLDGAIPSVETTTLERWACGRVTELTSREAQAGHVSGLTALLEMSLCAAGVLPVPDNATERLERIWVTGSGDAWLWAAAYAATGNDRWPTRALRAPLPLDPLMRGLVCLQRYQLTGDARWLAAVSRLIADNEAVPSLGVAILMAELRAPERAICPAFLVPLDVCSTSAGETKVASCVASATA